MRIRSRRQFGPLARVDSTDNDTIALSYGLGVGVLQSPYGRAFFKEGHDDGWGHYSICFPDRNIAIVLMTNNDNGESIFNECWLTPSATCTRPGSGKTTCRMISRNSGAGPYLYGHE